MSDLKTALAPVAEQMRTRMRKQYPARLSSTATGLALVVPETTRAALFPDETCPVPCDMLQLDDGRRVVVFDARPSTGGKRHHRLSRQGDQRGTWIVRFLALPFIPPLFGATNCAMETPEPGVVHLVVPPEVRPMNKRSLRKLRGGAEKAAASVPAPLASPLPTLDDVREAATLINNSRQAYGLVLRVDEEGMLRVRVEKEIL